MVPFLNARYPICFIDIYWFLLDVLCVSIMYNGQGYMFVRVQEAFAFRTRS
jgi:hypothetical protein